METYTVALASTDDINLRIEDTRYNARSEKKRKERWRPLGDFNWTVEKHKLPAEAVGGQLVTCKKSVSSSSNVLLLDG